MLKQLPVYKNSSIVRSRVPETLEKCDIVVDVGGVYDASNQRFDHHQRGFDETFSNTHAVKLSSAGLVYKHFGRQVICQVLEDYSKDWKSGPISESETEALVTKMYEDLIQSVDAIDNGIYQYKSQSEVEIVYKQSTDLASRIGRLNPSWNEDASDDDRMVCFLNAIQVAGEEFLGILKGLVKSWLPARGLISKAVEDSKSSDASGQVLVLHDSFPWKSALLEWEIEHNAIGQFKYALYTDTSGMWRIQTVPENALKSFSSRISLPESWRGLRDEALVKESGIPGCTFVHAAGFIGGNASFEGVMEMAKKSLIQ